MAQIDSGKDLRVNGEVLETNSNFQKVLDELQALGSEAARRAIDDPRYQQFIKLYPANRLPQLSLAEYCVGKGDGESFCWWLERGLQSTLGRYMPGTSRGHILYFQKDGSVYKHRRLKDMSDTDALAYTLRIQTAIAQADMNANLDWVDDDQLLYQRAGVGGCAEFCVNGQSTAGAGLHVRKHNDNQEARSTRRIAGQPAGRLQEA